MPRAQTTTSGFAAAQFYRWLAIILFFCSFPLSLYVPIWISWENQVLENAQAVVLLLGAAASFVFALKSEGRMRIFWFAVTPIWIIMCARELSWGAVFFEPTFASEQGPLFASSQLWYHPYRTPVVLALIAATALGFAISNAPRLFHGLIAGDAFPFFDIAGFVVAMLFSTAAENHVGLSIDWWPGHNQIIEEGTELAAYIFLLSGQQHVWMALAAGLKRKS